ncbi:MAG: HAMP domain-containing sensor histidine kinase [Candidatus Nanopelagicaceae bacterium]
MKFQRKKSLMTQMLVGQTFLILLSGLILVGTASYIAPSIFHEHLEEAGVTSQAAHAHVTEAFTASFNLALIISAITSLIVSGFIAWVFMRRIVKPMERVTLFAETLAAGNLGVHPNFDRTSSELDRLATALAGMSADLALSKENQERLLSDLAHELRTPIATVGAIVDGIEDGVVHGDAHSWQTIRDQLEKLNRLSHDVREVSQNLDQSLSKVVHPVDPNLIATSAFAAWRPRYENKEVRLKIHVADELPMLNVDAQRIGQVLSNLLENALRHTSGGDEVTLEVKAEKNRIQFTVRDNGEGMDAHQLPHIFDRLYRGDSARTSGDSGSGLGLTIARSIAQGHGGTLTASSEGRQLGSTFTLSLPD